MLETGSLLDGKYKILHKIGEGGMSTVYLAINEKANKHWAIKEIKRERYENYEVEKQSLINEMTLLKELKHPYLPSIVDIIENEDRIFIVMDYVEGKSFSNILKEKGRLSQKEVVGYAIELCDVLDYLHSRKPPVIYRDLKPENIILGFDKKVRLIDFGCARRYNPEKKNDTLSLGTPGYAAPEQFFAHAQSDARTDIYNLGATMYHLLTGINPGDPPYELYPIRKWNKELSKGLEKIIQKATKNDPQKRFNNCRELSYALAHFKDYEENRVQKRKKARFISVLICIVFFVIAGAELKRRDTVKLYNEYLFQAAMEMSNEDIKSSERVLELYQKAINLSPGKGEAYIRMLDYYLSLGKGETGKGLMAVSAMIASGKGSLSKNHELMMKMGGIYFGGNARDEDFLINYETAAEYFVKVDTKRYPEAQYYYALSKALSEININWENIAGDMERVDEYLRGENDEIKKCEVYIILSKIYLANAFELQKLGKNPLDKAIVFFEKAREIAESPYMDVEVGDKYLPEIYFGLGDGYYRKANGRNKKDLYQGITYYEKYLEFAPGEQKITIRNKIGDMYRMLKEYEKAKEEYEKIILDYPEDATAYVSMATMFLMDMKDEKSALEIYNRIKDFPAMESNANFISLQSKIKNLGDES